MKIAVDLDVGGEAEGGDILAQYELPDDHRNHGMKLILSAPDGTTRGNYIEATIYDPNDAPAKFKRFWIDTEALDRALEIVAPEED